MAIVYNVEDGDEEYRAAARHDASAKSMPTARPVFTPLVCIGLMVFYVLAMQCMSTLAIVRRETNSLALAALPARLHDRSRLGRRAGRLSRRTPARLPMNPAIEQFAVAAAVGGAFGFLLLRPLLRRKNGKACGGDCCPPRQEIEEARR